MDAGPVAGAQPGVTEMTGDRDRDPERHRARLFAAARVEDPVGDRAINVSGEQNALRARWDQSIEPDTSHRHSLPCVDHEPGRARPSGAFSRAATRPACQPAGRARTRAGGLTRRPTAARTTPARPQAGHGISTRARPSGERQRRALRAGVAGRVQRRTPLAVLAAVVKSLHTCATPASTSTGHGPRNEPEPDTQGLRST